MKLNFPCRHHCRGLLKAAPLLFLALAVLMPVFVSCSSPPDPQDGPSADVSNIPWNRQESWEGNPYGAFMPGSR